MNKLVFTHKPTTEQKLLKAMQLAAKVDCLSTVVVHVGTKKGEQEVRETLRQLTPERLKLELDIVLNPRVYHNGSRVLEIALEDYVTRNGWRRDYVDLGTWKSEELTFSGLNAS